MHRAPIALVLAVLSACADKTTGKPESARAPQFDAAAAKAPSDSLEVANAKLACLKAPGIGITVIGNDKALQALELDPGRCTGEITGRPRVDFARHALVAFSGSATCNGVVNVDEPGFVWSQWGDCERAMELVAFKIVDKDKAKSQVAREVPWLENPHGRVAMMGIFASHVREGRVEEARKFVPRAGIEIIRNTTGEGAKTDKVKRKPNQLTAKDLAATDIATKKIVEFNCEQPPKDKEFVCLASGEGYMNGYTLAATDSGFEVRKLEESEH